MFGHRPRSQWLSMVTRYGLRFDSYLGHSGDTSFNLFENLTDAQKGIDTLLWVFTATGGFCCGATLELFLDAYEDGRPVTTANLTACIVLGDSDGQRYPLNTTGVLEGAEFPRTEELVVVIAGRRLAGPDFTSFARPWIDWSRVSFDQDPNAGAYSWDEISDRPFGLGDLLICTDAEIRQALRFDPVWLAAGDRRVIRIAESIRESGDVSSLWVLADALEMAGCDNPWFPWHLRLPAAAHTRGSWVINYLLELAGQSVVSATSWS